MSISSGAVARAKFFVSKIEHLHTQNPGDKVANILLQPVYGDSPENKSWSKYTPQGEIKMTITNPSAVEKFEIGQAYFVDFTPVS